MSKFKHCGRGVCAAEAGHKGTCAQASGWDEFTADVADRAYESGLADGRAEAVAEEPEWGIAHVATPGSVWPLSEDGARETAAIEPGQWIIYSRPKTVTHEWVPVKQEGAETDD